MQLCVLFTVIQIHCFRFLHNFFLSKVGLLCLQVWNVNLDRRLNENSTICYFVIPTRETSFLILFVISPFGLLDIDLRVLFLLVRKLIVIIVRLWSLIVSSCTLELVIIWVSRVYTWVFFKQRLVQAFSFANCASKHIYLGSETIEIKIKIK